MPKIYAVNWLGRGDVGVGGGDGAGCRIGPELARLHRKAEGLEHLRAEDIGAEGRKAPGFLGSQFLLGAIEAEGNDFQIAIVGQRNLDGLVNRQRYREGWSVPQPQRER